MTIRGLILLMLFGVSLASFCQETNDPDRPKIGVVLSGGGAKGISHIGVLKAMEKAGIRPDFIVGTSMGAVIGGLYAIGYSADTLQKMVEDIDWDQILSNKIPLNYIAYEEKYYYDRYLINFPIEKFKVKLPNGLIEGQMLSETLSDFAWPSGKYENFDEFPIPFRCVATDVSTGNEYVFKDGPLSIAMRSSMAIPTAFTSVDVDSTLFVDGGIVNNFPVEILEEMGADIIIGVNVSSSGFEQAKEINNIPGILMQMAMINSLQKLPEQIDKCDIYIEPDLDGYSTASFSSYAEILQIGDDAGAKYLPEFQELANQLNFNDTSYYGISTSADAIVINEIVLTGNRLTPDYVIRGKLNINEGDLIDRQNVEAGVRSVFGLNNFRKVAYHIDKVSGINEYKIYINMIEKTPATFLASIHYDNTFSAGVILNLTLKNILLKGSRSIFAVDISENPKFRVDYLKYFGMNQHFAFDVIYDYHLLELPIYDKGEIKDFNKSNYHNLDLGVLTTQSLKHSFGLGYQFTSFIEKQQFSFALPESVEDLKSTYQNVFFTYNRNSLNDRNFPTKGSITEVVAKTFFSTNYKVNLKSGQDSILYDGVHYGNDDLNNVLNAFQPDYFLQAYLNHSTLIHFNSKFQMIPRLALGVTLSTEPDSVVYGEHEIGLRYRNFNIGGRQRVNVLDTRIFGLNYSEIQAPNFAIIGLTLQNVVMKNLFIQYGVELFSYYKYVPINNLSSIDWDKIYENSMIGYGIELRYKSLVGPISFGISRNTSDSYYRIYFQLGYSFNYVD